MSPTYESMKPGKQIHIYQNREHFLLFSLDSSSSSSHTASCQICYTISALLQDELLFVKALQHFSAEPESQQSQALTLLDCDMQWHAVSQPQKTMFDVSLHIWLQATAAFNSSFTWNVHSPTLRSVYLILSCPVCLHLQGPVLPVTARCNKSSNHYALHPSFTARVVSLWLKRRTTELYCSRLVRAEL